MRVGHQANRPASRGARDLRATGQRRDLRDAGGAQLPEHEIAALAASGLTNKQIAEQLFLSPRTVSHHLRKIFPKLGSTTRAARRDGIDGRTPGVLPAEFAEPVVVDAEMVGDLVDDGPADLVGDVRLGAADRADGLAVDGDAVGQYPAYWDVRLVSGMPW